jgi:hypothetical protein
MDILHNVSFNSDSSPKLLNAIEELGITHKVIELSGGGGKAIFFEISESDPLWENILQLLKTNLGFDIYRGGDVYETFFTDDDIRAAEWLRLIPTFEQGYLQPKANWPFKQMSLSNVCAKCGIYEQTSNMYIKKEPKLGKKDFMTLIGTGEIFVSPSVLSGIDSIGAKGYEVWEAIIHKTKQPSKEISQIYIPRRAQPGLVGIENMRQVICPICGVVKYYPHKKGLMHLKKDVLLSGVDFFRTHEWFGSGLIAYREIIISNRIARLILDKGWQGVRLKVVKLV